VSSTFLLKLGIAALFVASALYVHFRGRVRHGLARQLTGHSTFLAPINTVLYLSSKVPSRPFLDVAQFPELAPLQQNWQTIRDEALALHEGGRIGVATGYNDLGFNSFFKTGWTRFYLTWYGESLPSALQACPQTMRLLQSIPRRSRRRCSLSCRRARRCPGTATRTPVPCATTSACAPRIRRSATSTSTANGASGATAKC